MDEIKPCPNPGCAKLRDPELWISPFSEYSVRCFVCGMNGPKSREKQGAITAWNNLPRGIDAEYNTRIDDYFANVTDKQLRIDYERVLATMFDVFDTVINECPHLIVKPDPELMKLADDLVRGIEVD